MGLNCGIIKHAGNAGVPSAAAGFRWINDDLQRSRYTGAGRPAGWYPARPTAIPTDRDDQLPSATEKVDEFAKVKSRRLSRVYNFVSVIRFELSWLSYIRVLSTKRELRDGGSFQQTKHDSEPEDWMADDEVEHAEIRR